MNSRESFKYIITLYYIYQNKQYTIDSNHIKSLIIDSNYNDLNMPIIFLQLSLDKNIIDDIIDNMNTKKITMRLSRYVQDTNFKILKDSILDEFDYIITETKNKTKELDYLQPKITDKNKKILPVFKDITIGLIKKKIIDNNKKLINGIFLNTSLANIIYYHSKHMKLLIEPLKLYILDTIIIPPLDSYTKLISYLDLNYKLYDTPYRLFYDLDKTYLLSSSGNMIKSKDELLSSIIINIHKTIDDKSKIRGVRIDASQQVYIIDVDSKDTNVIKNENTSLSFNKTLTITNLGKNNIDKIYNNDNIRINRIKNDNHISNINPNTKKDIIINIYKTELDNTIFTINKEYYINNYNNTESSGKYILIRKKEVYMRENNEFNLVSILSFKKVQS